MTGLVAQRLKHLPAMRETWVRSLGREDPLEKEMATHSSILAWRIPWTKSLVGYSPQGRKKSDTAERLYLAFEKQLNFDLNLSNQMSNANKAMRVIREKKRLNFSKNVVGANLTCERARQSFIKALSSLRIPHSNRKWIFTKFLHPVDHNLGNS